MHLKTPKDLWQGSFSARKTKRAAALAGGSGDNAPGENETGRRRPEFNFHRLHQEVSRERVITAISGRLKIRKEGVEFPSPRLANMVEPFSS